MDTNTTEKPHRAGGPAGLKCEVTPDQAYPRGVPEIPGGWEFARFGYSQPLADDEGILCSNGTLSGVSVPREARIIVRRKPVKTPCLYCGKPHEQQPSAPKPRMMEGSSLKPSRHSGVHPESDLCSSHPACVPVDPEPTPRMMRNPDMRVGSTHRDTHTENADCGLTGCIHVEPPAPAKPRMMQANPACLGIPILKCHAVEHPEIFGCSTPPICIPVEQPKARRWRTGSKVHVNIYEGDLIVGQCQTPEVAARIVEAMNRHGNEITRIAVLEAELRAARLDYDSLRTLVSKARAETAEERDTLRTLAGELMEALKRLRNESNGFLGMADRGWHGNTNCAVLKKRIEESDATLTRAEAALKS